MISELSAIVSQYFATTPFEIMAAQALFLFGWVPIFGVIVWGLVEVWQDYKQGDYWNSLKWHLLAVTVPLDAVQTPKGMENFFNNIAGSKSAITWREQWLVGKFQAFFSLEIVSIGGHIQYYMRVQSKYRDLLEAAFYAQYPEAQISEVEDYVGMIPDEWPNDDYDCWGTEMILKKKNFLPIKTYEQFEHMGEKDNRYKDTLLPLLEMMGKMRPGENLMIQLIIKQPDEQDWVKEGKKFIEKLYGRDVDVSKPGFFSSGIGWIPGEFLKQLTGLSIGEGTAEKDADDFRMFKITPEERDQMEAVRQKITKIGWQTKIRFVYFSKKELFRKGTIASMMKGYFHQFGDLTLNQIGIHEGSTPKDDYFWMDWQLPGKQRSLVNRYKLRHPFASSTVFYMNSAELATLFHFPAGDARTPVLARLSSRRSEAPIELAWAGDNEPDLPNLDRSTTDGLVTKRSLPKATGKLAVPKLSAPTSRLQADDNAFDRVPSAVKTADALYQPRAGMPAPLPPGFDLSPEAIDGKNEVPPNLPI